MGRSLAIMVPVGWLTAVVVTQSDGLGPAETAEASAVEHHRLAAGGAESDDGGDDQDMVPAVELTLNRAVDPSHRTVNSGRSQRR